MEDNTKVPHLLSDFLFTWVFKTLKPSSPPPLCEIPPCLSLSSPLSSLKSLWSLQLSSKSPSFTKPILSLFSQELFICCCIHLLSCFSEVAAAFLVKEQINFLSDDSAPASRGILLAFGIIFLVVVNCFANSMTWYRMQMLTIRIRCLIVMMISEKIMKVNSNYLNEGNILNVISSDMEIFDFFMYTPYLICIPFDLISTALVVSYGFNVSGLIGIAVSILHVPLIGMLAVIGGGFRNKCFQLVDKRIKLVNHLIHGMKIFKFYAWELRFIEKIRKIRTEEINERFKMAFTGVLMITFSLGGIALVIFVTFYINLEWIKNIISIAEMYMLITIYFSTHIRTVHNNAVAILTSFLLKKVLNRVTKILLLPENTAETHSPHKNLAISMKNAFFSTKPKSQLEPIPLLHNISFKLIKSSLLIVIGPVGSGKSALLNAIQNELFLTSGKSSVLNSISYVSEVPWIISGTIRENIIIGLPYNHAKYQKVLFTCALNEDVSNFLHEDETWIGERGVTLSGGQKARINLARGLYRNSDLLLLDDPLSSVDPKVCSHIFEECVLGCKNEGKTVVLVTHQIQFVGKADKVILMKDRSVEFFGSPQELDTKSEIVEGIQKSKAVVVDDDSKDFRFEDDHGLIEEEMNETLSKGEVYQYFIGGCKSFAFILLGVVLACFGQAAMQMFLYWSSHRDELGQISVESFLNSLSYLLASVYGSLFIGILYISMMLVKCNSELHNRSLTSIATSPSVYFDNNPSGRIINRFSKDLSNCDDSLHHYIIDSVVVGGGCLGSIIVIMIISPLALVSVPFYFLVLYFIIGKLSMTIDSLRKKENLAKAPVLSLMNSILDGILTIRAQKLQKVFVKNMKSELQHYFRCFITYQSYLRFCQMYSHLSCITIVIVNLIVILNNKSNSHLSLLAYSLAISLTMSYSTSLACKDIIELRGYMLSAQRLIEYQSLQTESLTSSTTLKITKGKIRFEEICFKYQPHLPTILQEMSFKIRAGQKIGIVGRTGSGKSSILHVLCRLGEPFSGTVFIDGQDYRKVGLHELRKQISVIPQSTVLFSTSLRENLDPFGTFSDKRIRKVLKLVKIDWIIKDEGLDLCVGGKGRKLSAGEKQLICVARAILNKNKVVVLDEATSGVDLETDQLVQRVFKKEFAVATLIVIAHRMRSVVDSDRVMVVEDGRCVEFGRPVVLFEDENSRFFKMALVSGLCKESFSGNFL